ncbi:MAG: PTS sugar transporter subunit IIA [Pseudomonadota bacterium]
MKLVVRDVSRLLNVSEKTVYRWIAQRSLPAHRINDQYRFNRTELLEWATANSVPFSAEIFEEDHPGALPRLADSLRAGGIFHRVSGLDKPAVLAEAVRLMPLPPEVDRAYLLEVFLAREALGSTGIGQGLALPHVRNPAVMHIPRPMVSLCFLERPVEFGALDGLPVHTLFSIVSPTIRGHLHLLSKLSFALQQPEFKAVIDNRARGEAIIRQAEKIEKSLAAGSREKTGEQS